MHHLDNTTHVELLIRFPWYHVHRDSIFPGISDNFAPLLGNILVYWALSLIYHGLDVSGWNWLDKYRIRDSEAEETKTMNQVTRGEAVRSVAFQQLIQTIFGYIWLAAFAESKSFQNHAAKLRLLSRMIISGVSTLIGADHAHAFMKEYSSSLTYNMY